MTITSSKWRIELIAPHANMSITQDLILWTSREARGVDEAGDGVGMSRGSLQKMREFGAQRWLLGSPERCISLGKWSSKCSVFPPIGIGCLYGPLGCLSRPCVMVKTTKRAGTSTLSDPSTPSGLLWRM